MNFGGGEGKGEGLSPVAPLAPLFLYNVTVCEGYEHTATYTQWKMISLSLECDGEALMVYMDSRAELSAG